MSKDTYLNLDSFGSIRIEPPKNKMPANDLVGMKPIHPHLPQIPFFVGIIGPRHSGKSVWLYSVLRKDMPGMYGEAFRHNNIILFSPTKDKDPTLKSLKLKHVFGPPTSAQVVVESILNQQRVHAQSESMTGVLLVFDDITQLKDAWIPLQELSYCGRHDHTHVLYVAHKMSSIPRGVRTQTQQWIIFKPHEESEHQWILDMFSKRSTKEIWESALARAWAQEFNFVIIDFERKEPLEIYRSGFEQPLFTPEEIEIVMGLNQTPYFRGDPVNHREIDPDPHLPVEETADDMDDVQQNGRKRKRKRKEKKMKKVKLT